MGETVNAYTHRFISILPFLAGYNDFLDPCIPDISTNSRTGNILDMYRHLFYF